MPNVKIRNQAQECVIYVRISEDREGGGLGVARQEKDCRALAATLGWRVVHVYVDNDLSAFSGKTRPAYLELLDAVRAAEVVRVLVWHTDRLHRTPRELEDYIDAADMRGAVTHTVKAGIFDLATPAGRAVARTLCAWARYEVEHAAERQRAKAVELAEAGKPGGGMRPFGWLPDRVTLDPVEHAVIIEVAGRLLAGESQMAVAADLNARGVLTVHQKHVAAVQALASEGLTRDQIAANLGVPGKRVDNALRRAGPVVWSAPVLRAMLSRPRMAGLRSYKGEVVGKAVWQPALDEGTWRTLRDVLNDPGRAVEHRSPRWLLPGIARCPAGHLLGTVHGARSRPEASRVSYCCKACGVYRSAAAVDEMVTGAVLELLADLTPAPPATARADLGAEIGEVKARLAAGADAYADGAISLEELTRASRRLRARLAELEREATPARRRRVTAGLTGPGAAETWETLPLDRRRAVVAELVEVTVHPVGISRRVFDPTSVKIRQF